MCGTRRTVVGREAPILAGLEFGGFFDVPQRVSIKNQLVMAFCGIESGILSSYRLLLCKRTSAAEDILKASVRSTLSNTSRGGAQNVSKLPFPRSTPQNYRTDQG